jgi:hypothetical protein
MYNFMKKLFFTISALVLSSFLTAITAQNGSTSTTESKEITTKKEGEQPTTLPPSEIKPVKSEAVKLHPTPVKRIHPLNPSTVAPTIKEEEINTTPPNQK